MIPSEIIKKIRQIEIRTNRLVCGTHYQPKRFFISALTGSHRMPRSGCFIASSARRSSSAICSGVSSGSYPFSVIFCQTRWASLMRSPRLTSTSALFFKAFHGDAFFGRGGALYPWKPSMNSSARVWASSTRSSNVNFFAAANSLATLMDQNYFYWPLAQAVTSQSAFS
jgi:hypothetical protein